MCDQGSFNAIVDPLISRTQIVFVKPKIWNNNVTTVSHTPTTHSQLRGLNIPILCTRWQGLRVAVMNGTSQNIGHFEHNPNLETATRPRLNAKHIDERAWIVDVTIGKISQAIC